MPMRVNVTAFKSRCLGYIDAVASGRQDRVILTRHGRAVAELRPLQEPEPRPAVDLHGALRGTGRVPPGVDITEPTGEVWEADEE
jgi:antitoxin (DNA-binding transcriptional repressor) of toxin-antitoxin stability system